MGRRRGGGLLARAALRPAGPRGAVRRRAPAARPLRPRAGAGGRVMRPLGLAATGAVLALCACGGSPEEAPARSEPAATASTPASPAHAAAGRLRLVTVGSFDSPLYVT